ASLSKGQKIVRGWLGVSIQPLDDAMAKELGVSTGVVVHQVQSESPAEKAGIKAGDVILEAAGKSVKNVSQLQRVISGYKPGNKVPIKVVNYDTKKSRTIDVLIGELPSTETAATEEGSPSESSPDRLGLATSKTSGGVKVDRVAQGSAGESLGFEPGDVI